MKRTVLPVHPTKRHPLTGQPLQAIWVNPAGRVLWPMMGGSEDAGAEEGSADDDADKGGDDKPPADKNADKGFPENTPVKDMSADQQAAYHAHQSRKHEQRNRDLLAITGGRYGTDLAADLAELARLRDAGLSDGERAVEEARKAGRREAAVETARMAFELTLGHDPETNDLSDLIDTLDLAKVLTDDGKVDTAKVQNLASKIAPADKGTGGGSHDYGAGRRGGTPKSGVGAGREMYDSRKK